MTHPYRTIACLVVCLLCLAGCSGTAESTGDPKAGDAGATTPGTAPGASDSTGGEARTLPIPGHAGAATAPGGSGPLVWQAPEHWVAQTPANNIRLAQYRVDGEAGPAECVVFYFGPGQGGDPLANAERWAGQLLQPDGSSSLDSMQVEDIEGSRLPARLVQVTGNYTGGMSPADGVDNAMLLGGIVEGPDAPWFFKFVGPEATVSGERDAFVSLLRSVGADE